MFQSLRDGVRIVSQTTAAASGDFGADRDKLGMWFFLCSDAMMFAALFVGYAMVRIANISTWPLPETILNIPLTSVFTFDLIVSSVTMVKAFEASDRGDQRWTKIWLGATIFFGLCFLGFQAYEWGHFFNEGFIPGAWSMEALKHEAQHIGSDPATLQLFFGTFFALTGFHGLHVTCGVIYNSVVLFNTSRGKYDSQEDQSKAIEIAGLYWHLVDLVWILLFTFVYLF
jgi:heme/copper-type cytochrome/quinol oxidase subunit 3